MKRHQKSPTHQTYLGWLWLSISIGFILLASTSMPAFAQDATPTPISGPMITPSPTPGGSPTPRSGPLGTPLPPGGPAPIAVWRPPLYPVPWSLTNHDHFFFTRPIAADEVNWPLPNYRYAGTYFGPNIPHTGVDIVVPEGTPVLAAGQGQVFWTGYGLYRGTYDTTDPYGIAVAILHDFGFNGEPLVTVYAHLSEALVVEGQRVSGGQVLGKSGATGFVTGPHLHFEVRLGTQLYSNTYNPELWLSPPEGWGVLTGYLTDSSGIPLANHGLTITNLDTGDTWHPETYDTLLGINPDPYYDENFVLSDLPAGRYEIYIPYEGSTFKKEIQIFPGGVSYFSFRGFYGISLKPPRIQTPKNVPTQSPG